MSKILFNPNTDRHRFRQSSSQGWEAGRFTGKTMTKAGQVQAWSNTDRQAENKTLDSAACANNNLAKSQSKSRV